MIIQNKICYAHVTEKKLKPNKYWQEITIMINVDAPFFCLLQHNFHEEAIYFGTILHLSEF